MKVNQWIEATIVSASLMLGVASYAWANESVSEKAKATAAEAQEAAGKTWRNAKNEICTLVKGQVECAAEAAMDRAKRAADETGERAKKATDFQ